MKRLKIKVIANERGQLTLGFLYGVTLILCATTLMISLTFALTVTEALQYVAFAGARAYYAGAVDESTQIQAAREKVEGDLLKTLPFLSGAISNDWIKIVSGGPDNYGEYATAGGAPIPRNRIIGYQIEYEVPILGIRLPLIGETITPPEGESFRTRVNAFIMREPTEKECLDFYKGAYQALTRNGGYNVAGVTAEVILDNGC